jgi:hypothetical protein
MPKGTRAQRDRDAPQPSARSPSPTTTPHSRNFSTRDGGTSSGSGRWAANSVACPDTSGVATVCGRLTTVAPRFARQLAGKVHLRPLVDRSIDLRAEHDVQRPRTARAAGAVILRACSRNVIRPVCCAAALHLPRNHAIDGVTHARRAVVEEVVVFVEPVLGTRVLLERRAQRQLLRGSSISSWTETLRFSRVYSPITRGSDDTDSQ